jgi:acyl homoserine lactone synthase
MLIAEKGYRRAGKNITSQIFMKEDCLIVKDMITEHEKIQAFHLRHRIFCQELGWLRQTVNTMEKDDYDSKAIFFGVFDRQNNLLAFLRVIMNEAPFMLENDFVSLVMPGYNIRKEDDTIEVSRFCVAPEARNDIVSENFRACGISMLLYKGVYHWSIKHKKRYLYLVVEYKIYRLLRVRGFPCKLLGDPQKMSDGVIAVAAMIDWREFEALNLSKRPEMLKWFNSLNSKSVTVFNQDQSIFPEWRLRRPGAGLRRQAFPE